MRKGLAGTPELSKTMPWAVLSNMTDEDLAAILAYLKTLRWADRPTAVMPGPRGRRSSSLTKKPHLKGGA